MNHGDENPAASARALIEQVLQTERMSIAGVDAARHEAQTLVAQATEQAQRITRRCESRMQRVHEQCAAVLDQELQRLQTDAALALDDPAEQALEAKHIEDIVARLAESLTSSSS